MLNDQKNYFQKSSFHKNPLLLRFALALVSGAFLAVLAPPLNIAWAAWFAYVPMLWVMRDGGTRSNAWLAFVYGFAGNICIFWWLIDAISVFSSVPWFAALLLLCLLSVVLALPLVILFISVHWLRNSIGNKWILVFPAVQVCLEYLMIHIAPFPYQFGNSQYQAHYMFQIVSVTGIWGVTFLILLVNAAIAEQFYRHREGRGPDWRPLAAVFMLVVVNVIWGYGQFNRVEAKLQKAEPVRLLQLQSDVDSKQWKDMMKDRALRISTSGYWYEQTLKLKPNEVDLVIWPESSIVADVQHPAVQKQLAALSRNGRFDLIVGAMDYSATPPRRAIHNSVFLFNQSGELQTRYDKMVLVPFSEYVPLADYLPFVTSSIKMDSGHFKHGTKAIVAQGERYNMAFPICYEAIFHSSFRNYDAANLIINVTNDLWFADSNGAYLHAMLSIIRATEFGQPMIRTAHSGLSFFVEPHGVVRYPTELFEQVNRIVELRVSRVNTFYSRYSDWFVVVCALLVLVVILRPMRINRGRLD